MSGTTSFTVASTADLNAAIQAIDLTGASSAPNTAYTISFTSGFTLTGQLDAINLASGDTLAIQGNGATLNGGGRYSGVFDYAGNVTISDLAIVDAKAAGGGGGSGFEGGGGGAGLGGGLFVASGGAVTLSNVVFGSNSAVGGAGGAGVYAGGGSSIAGFGGGGGLDGGAGGNGFGASFFSSGGGGGIGVAARGGVEAAGGAAGAGIVLGADGGGTGLNGVATGNNGVGSAYHQSAGSGAKAAGGGGFGYLSGAGGGVGGSSASSVTGGGGNGGGGGFGGGGGGSGPNVIGVGGAGGGGGFGGGGGSSGGDHFGGTGGFGGGGGGGSTVFGSGSNGGFGGGTGSTYGGGGGLGAGGAIFVQQGGSLTVASGSVSGGSVAGGAGNNGGTNGSAFGAGLFLQGNEQVTLSAAAAQPLTISDAIADQTGSGGTGAGSLVIQGSGTVTLEGADTYTGGTTISSGTLALESATAAGAGAITFGPSSAATLLFGAGGVPANTIKGFAPGETIDLAGLGRETTVTPGANNAYTFSGGGGGPVTLTFAAPIPFGDLFQLASDNQGGTDVTLAPPLGPTITGTAANQATTDEMPISPFAHVTIIDPTPGATDAVTITLTNAQGQATDADGRLSAVPGLTETAAGTYALAAPNATTLNGELDQLVFLPTLHQVAPGQSVTTTFAISDHSSVGKTATDATTSVIATAVNDPPSIFGTKAGQAVSNNAAIQPFSGVAVADPDLGVQDSLIITLTGAGGTLSGASPSPTGPAGTYSLAAASPANLSSELDALLFTPAAGAPGTANTTTFTLTASQTAGGSTVTTTDNTTTVINTVTLQPPTITGVKAGQATTDEKAIAPFTGVTITDPDAGATDAVSVTPSNTANGSLSDPNQSTDGGVFDNGAYIVEGSASTVTAALRGLVFTPTAHQVAPGQTVTTSFTINDVTPATRGLFNPTGPIVSDSTTSVVATAVNDKPAITGTKAGQAVSNNAAIQPFTGVSITDPDVGVQDSLTITLGGAGGTLSGAGLSPTGTAGTYSLAAASPATLTAALDALTFTPAAGAPGTAATTTFALTASQTAGGSTVTATDSTTTVIDTVPVQPSTISVPASDQPQTSTGLATVTPFKGATITDTNQGSPTETVTVTPSSTMTGTLADPNKTDGSTVNSSNGAITLTGSASTVTTDLDALTFTPAFGQFGTTSFTIADLNSAGQTSTPGTASVTVNPPTLTAAQLKQVGSDVLQFYKDDLAHNSTTADTSKLATDFTTLDLSQAELGQLLGQTLASATLSSTAAPALGADLAATYYPKITADLAHAGQGLAPDLTALIATTAGAGADDLLRTHAGQSASVALAGTVHDFKLA